MRRRGAFRQREAETLTRQRVFELTVSIEFASLAQPSGITPALTERRERFEFVSGADGKIGEANHPRNEPTPTRDVASVQRIVIPRPTTSLSTS